MAHGDENLIRQCLNGDDGAFGFLVDKYKGAVQALAYRKIGNYHDAEEIAQETFLKAYQKLSTLKNPDGFAGWLYVICANCCRDWLRKRRKGKESLVSLKQLSGDEIAASSYVKYTNGKTEQSLREAVGTLPESERTVVTLYYMGGLSCGEISRFLGVSLSAAKMRLHRARRHLKKEMTGMIEQTWSKSQLGAGFTLRLMEVVQRMSPFSAPRSVPRKWIPIGALAAALILGVGSLFTSSTVPTYSPGGTQENMAVTLLESPQRTENPEIDFPVIATMDTQAGNPGGGLNDYNKMGEMSVLASVGNTTDEQEYARTFSINGVILLDGKPQARVSVYAVNSNKLEATTVSKADGTYHFSDLPMPYDGQIRRYAFFAGIDGKWIGWKRLGRQGFESVGVDNLSVQLLPAKDITGTVRDENGRAIHGAIVRGIKMDVKSGHIVLRGTPLPSAIPLFPSTSTDMDGKFTIHNIQDTRAPDSSIIRIEKEGYGALEKRPAEWPANIILEPAGAIEGRVMDSVTGKPAEGVLLACARITTRTASDGSYRFGGLAAGKYGIGLTKESLNYGTGRIAARIRNVSVDAGETAQAMDMKLVKGGVIRGRITTTNGEPMPGISVPISDSAGSRSARTDENGEYHFRVMTGKVRIPTDRLNNCVPQSGHPGEDLDISEGKEINSVDYIYVGIRVTGRVVTTDGKPVPDALIYEEIYYERAGNRSVSKMKPRADGTLGLVKEERYYEEAGYERFPRVKSKVDGTFALVEDFPEGTELRLAAEKASTGMRGEATFTVRPDVPVKIIAQENRLGSVYGRIVDASGEPQPDISVTISVSPVTKTQQGTKRQVYRQFKRTWTDENGRFWADGLPVDSLCHATANRKGYATRPDSRRVKTKGTNLGKIVLESVHKPELDAYKKPVVNVDPQAWTKKADMPTPRAAAACVVDGKVYAIGGMNGNEPLSIVEGYDPATDRWTKKADLPVLRAGLSVSAVNGRIYAIGGANEKTGPLSTVEEYDPAMDRWTRKADMPTARAALSTSVVNGKIYAIGGTNRNGFLSTIEEYDPATDKWAIKADMPTARSGFSTSTVGGKIYAVGGLAMIGKPDEDGRGANTAYPLAVEEYDPIANTWTKRADMPTARGGLSTSAINGRLYAMGGSRMPGAKIIMGGKAKAIERPERRKMLVFSSIEEYDPAADKWTKKGDMPVAKHSFSAVVVDGKIYVIGGSEDDATSASMHVAGISTVEEYTPR